MSGATDSQLTCPRGLWAAPPTSRRLLQCHGRLRRPRERSVDRSAGPMRGSTFVHLRRSLESPGVTFRHAPFSASLGTWSSQPALGDHRHAGCARPECEQPSFRNASAAAWADSPSGGACLRGSGEVEPQPSVDVGEPDPNPFPDWEPRRMAPLNPCTESCAPHDAIQASDAPNAVMRELYLWTQSAD